MVVVVVVVGKRAHGVGEVTNGVDEDRERVPVRTRAGTRQVPVGILVVAAVAEEEVEVVAAVVHGVVHPPGIYKSSTYIRRLPHSSFAHLSHKRSKTSARSPQLEVLDMINLLEVRSPS